MDFIETFICVRVTYPIPFVLPNRQQCLKYGIEIETNDSSFTLCHSLTWRRYSEFQYLQQLLKKNHYNIKVPNLPTQGIFKNREHPFFVENRRVGLEEFLKKVLSVSLYKADKALHLFLQTSLSTDHILFNLDGRRHDKVTDQNLPIGSSETINNNSTKLEMEEEKEEEKDSEKKPQVNYEEGKVEDEENMTKFVATTIKTKPRNNRAKKVTFCDEVLAVNLMNSSPVNQQL